MKVFENLDEAFMHINRSFLMNPHNTVDFIRGAQGFAEDIVLKVKNPVTTINLNDYAFDPRAKWDHLIRSYVDPDAFKVFWEQAAKVTGTSYQFRFKNKETSNGPCLIAIVLTRNESKSPWTRAKVIWRTAELQRKFAADMVLVHKFFEEVPDVCKSLVQIEEVTLYLAQAFQSWRLIGPLVPLFCDWEEVDTTHDFCQKLVANFSKVYEEPQPVLKFAPVIRMQKHYLKLKNGEVPHSHPDDLSLVRTLTSIEGRKK